jgi:alanine-glyoxylate transaminase/serine-glyoxylate transaminase/serine-pyruvate transaminase
MFYALREALVLVREEGIENRWDRHRRNHEAFVAGVEALGWRMHVAPAHRLWTLNTPRLPAGMDDARIRQRLLDQFGIEIAGGFGPLAGKILRIGLMGHSSTAKNAAAILDALRRVTQ